jgi:peptide/nickel transport system substrate-binding protein
MSKPHFQDQRVRHALNYAIDKEAIVNNILRGTGKVSTSCIASIYFGYKDIGTYEYNPEKARQLLEEAGYGDGLTLDFYHTTGSYLMDETIAEAIQAMLEEVGVEVNLVTGEMQAILSTIRVPPGESIHDMYMLGWGAAIHDAHYGMQNLFPSDRWPPRGGNNGYYQNERVDELISLGASENDPAERERMYHEAQEIIWEDAPWIFMYEETQVQAASKRIENIIYHITAIRLWEADIAK